METPHAVSGLDGTLGVLGAQPQGDAHHHYRLQTAGQDVHGDEQRERQR